VLKLAAEGVVQMTRGTVSFAAKTEVIRNLDFVETLASGADHKLSDLMAMVEAQAQEIAGLRAAAARTDMVLRSFKELLLSV
jgi:hypothetical protein